MTCNLTILTVNHDTPEFIYTLVSSYLKYNRNWLNTKITIIDNSVKSHVFADGEYEHFTIETIDDSLYESLTKYCNTTKEPTLASAHHALTIDWFMKNRVNTDFLLIIDSDILFTRSFEQEYNEFVKSSCIMSGFKRITYIKPCIAPWACFINMRLVKQYRLNYFDINRILYVNNNMQYDTGASFFEDCVKNGCKVNALEKDNTFYLHMKRWYIEHNKTQSIY